MKSVEKETKEEAKNSKSFDVKDGVISGFSWLEVFSFSSIIFLIFLLPFFYLTFNQFSLLQTKTFLIVYLILFALLLFTSYFLKNGVLRLGKYKILLLGISSLIPLTYFLASLFSGDVAKSFFGRYFELNTFIFIATCFCAFALTTLIFNDRKRIFLGFLTFLFSFLLLFTIQFLTTFLGLFPFSEGVDFSKFNFVGSWNEFAILAGAVSILSLITLQNVEPGLFLKISLYTILFFSILFLSLINFSLAFLLLGVFCFGVLIYSISKNSLQKKIGIFQEYSDNKLSIFKKYFFIIPLIIFLISGAFLFKEEIPSKIISNFANISQIEVRPSFDSTMEVGSAVYEKDLLLGSGPNTFKESWSLYKPKGINNSIFWNEDFLQSFSFILTSFLSTGFLGILAWFLFFACFLYIGARVLILYRAKEKFPYYLSLSSFIVSLYFWISLIFYTGSPVLLAFAFIFTGFFAASVSQTKEDLAFDFSVSDRPRLGFVIIFLFGIIFILGIGMAFVVTEKVSANTNFKRAVVLFQNKEKVKQADEYALKAISIDPQDHYLRLATDIKIDEIRALLSKNKELKENDYEKFRSLLASAIERGRLAISQDENYYRNLIKLGDVYSSVVSLNVTGSYEKAKEIYENAVELSPNSPLTYFKLAKVEAAGGNFKEAKTYIGEALKLKSNYTEAVFLLSQIQIKEGDIKDAIKSVESAVIMNPNDSTILFQLGVLYYNDENYEKAVDAFEKIISINDSYPNDRYFLGLSYYNLERREEAIKQFEEILKNESDNKEVSIMIENMKAGRDPFSEIKKDGEIEEENLPVQEL